MPAALGNICDDSRIITRILSYFIFANQSAKDRSGEGIYVGGRWEINRSPYTCIQRTIMYNCTSAGDRRATCEKWQTSSVSVRLLCPPRPTKSIGPEYFLHFTFLLSSFSFMSVRRHWMTSSPNAFHRILTRYSALRECARDFISFYHETQRSPGAEGQRESRDPRSSNVPIDCNFVVYTVLEMTMVESRLMLKSNAEYREKYAPHTAPHAHLLHTSTVPARDLARSLRISIIPSICVVRRREHPAYRSSDDLSRL